MAAEINQISKSFRMFHTREVLSLPTYPEYTYKWSLSARAAKGYEIGGSRFEAEGRGGLRECGAIQRGWYSNRS